MRFEVFFFASGVLVLAGCGGRSLDLDGGDAIALGSSYVAERGCSTCHQSANPSDGVLSGQATPRPGTTSYGRNLTPDPSTGLGNWADIEIVRAMRAGVDVNEVPLCPPMPRFGDMTDFEAAAVVAYLRSLKPVARPGGIPLSTCPPIKPSPSVDLTPFPAFDLADPAADLSPADLGATGDMTPGSMDLGDSGHTPG